MAGRYNASRVYADCAVNEVQLGTIDPASLYPHDWKPVDGECGAYKCAGCGETKVKKPMPTYHANSRFYKKPQEETPCLAKMPKPEPVQAMEEPKAPTPSQKNGLPEPPKIKRFPISDQIFYDLFVYYLAGRTGGSRSWTTVDHFAMVLRQIGLINNKWQKELYRSRELQHLFLRKAFTVRAFSEEQSRDVRCHIMIKAFSGEMELNRERVLKDYKIRITEGGKFYAASLDERFASIFPLKEIVEWEAAKREASERLGKIIAIKRDEYKAALVHQYGEK